MYPIRLTGGSTDRTVAHLHSLAAMDRNYVTNEVSVSDDGSGTYLFQLRHSQDFSYLAGHSAIGASLYVTLDHYYTTFIFVQIYNVKFQQLSIPYTLFKKHI